MLNHFWKCFLPSKTSPLNFFMGASRFSTARQRNILIFIREYLRYLCRHLHIGSHILSCSSFLLSRPANYLVHFGCVQIFSIFYCIFRYVIMVEETCGPWECTITLHNLLHVPEDTRRFGQPDNFWCYQQERAVKKYKKISTNYKVSITSFHFD